MWRSVLAGLAIGVCGWAQEPLAQRAQRYCADLVRIDTTNPPGNETRAAEYIRHELEREGIAVELLGDDPTRLNVVARLRGNGSARPLLLMAHTDVVPADPGQWTVPAFSAFIKDGFLYGRGTDDDKCLLAAEMAVMVELKRRGTPLRRDLILVAEADEETGSTGIRWLVKNAWPKIDAEFGLNEGGYADITPDGLHIFQVQTAEKIPTRLRLTATGTAGHGSVPRPDNAVVHLARAIVKVADGEQPVKLNATTSRYLASIAKLPEFRWIAPHLAGLSDPARATAAAAKIRARDPELGAILQTTVSPTMLSGGVKINVIPNTASVGIDVRRLPDETREEVLERVRRMVNDPAVQVEPANEQVMPATAPSALTTELYLAIEKVLGASSPRTMVIPAMSRGATDSSHLRQKGMALYGAPVFLRRHKENRAHGNDERIELTSLEAGAKFLYGIVSRVAATNGN